MPALKTIRKINACKINVFFSRIWPQIRNIWRAGFLRLATFSEHLLPTASEYPMLLPLTKIKNQNINIIGDKICIKSNIQEHNLLLDIRFNNIQDLQNFKLLYKSCSFLKLCVLKCKFQNFPTFLLVFIILNDVTKIFA